MRYMSYAKAVHLLINPLLFYLLFILYLVFPYLADIFFLQICFIYFTKSLCKIKIVITILIPESLLCKSGTQTSY